VDIRTDILRHNVDFEQDGHGLELDIIVTTNPSRTLERFLMQSRRMVPIGS